MAKKKQQPKKAGRRKKAMLSYKRTKDGRLIPRHFIGAIMGAANMVSDQIGGTISDMAALGDDATGGDKAMAAAQNIPIFGSIFKGISDAKKMKEAKKEQDRLAARPSVDTNPYANGGFINYRGPRHERGGIMVKSDGKPTNKESEATAEVEGGEVAYQFSRGGPKRGRRGLTYIFSDRLPAPDGKGTFADKAKSIQKRYTSKDRITQDHLRREMSKLAGANDIARKLVSGDKDGNLMAAFGGQIRKLAPGGFPDPFVNFLTNYQKQLEAAGMVGKMDEQPHIRRTSESIAQTTDDPSHAVQNAVDTYVRPAFQTNAQNNEKASDNPSNPGVETQSPTHTAPQLENPDMSRKMNVGDAIALSTNLAPLASSAMDAFSKKRMVPNFTPDMSAGDARLAGMTTSAQPQLNEIARATMAGMRGLSGQGLPTGALAANVASVASRAGEVAGGVVNQNQQQLNRLKQNLAGRDDKKAILRAQGDAQQFEAQEQFDAARRGARRTFAGDIQRAGNALNEYNYMRDVQADENRLKSMGLRYDLMNTMLRYPNFSPSPDLAAKLQSGNFTQEDLAAFNRELIEHARRLGAEEAQSNAAEAAEEAAQVDAGVNTSNPGIGRFNGFGSRFRSRYGSGPANQGGIVGSYAPSAGLHFPR